MFRHLLLPLAFGASYGVSLVVNSDAHNDELNLLLQVTSSHGLMHTDKALTSGQACNNSSSSCAEGLACSCLAENRGLHICMQPKLVSPPSWALKWQRHGLVCDAVLPAGLAVMPAPPVADSGLEIIDPRTTGDAKLREWALGPGHSFYTQYAVVHAPGAASKGVPILAGNDVPRKKVMESVATVQHLLNEAAVEKHTLASTLADSGIRILLAGSAEGAWQKHPEVSAHFQTGLGGGAPWWPSTGIRDDEPPNTLVEELFHTIQYTVMQPMDVCMYHKAYVQAVSRKLYTTDGSADEVDGEPVPTVQADEYLAMALQRWIGFDQGHGEYAVPGNHKQFGKATGRENLKNIDPQAFCLIAKVFRSDDTWNPSTSAKPWKTNPNRGMDVAESASFCQPVLAKLSVGCPSADTHWPKREPNVILANLHGPL